LQLLCESCNGNKSSLTMEGEKIDYVDSVGALFTELLSEVVDRGRDAERGVPSWLLTTRDG